MTATAPTTVNSVNPVNPVNHVPSALAAILIKTAAAHTGHPARKIHTLQSRLKSDRPILHTRGAIALILHERHAWDCHTIARAFASNACAIRKSISRARENRSCPAYLALLSALESAA